MTEYQEKCNEIANKLGFEITIEGSDVYLESEDTRSHFMSQPSVSWRQIYLELSRWGEGCNLVAPVNIS